MKKNTEIFSLNPPDELLDAVIDFIEKSGYKHKLVDSQYKVKYQILSEGEEEVDVTAKITRVNKDKYCIEFERKGGDSLAFYNHFNNIKEFLGDLINANN